MSTSNNMLEPILSVKPIDEQENKKNNRSPTTTTTTTEGKKKEITNIKTKTKPKINHNNNLTVIDKLFNQNPRRSRKRRTILHPEATTAGENDVDDTNNNNNNNMVKQQRRGSNNKLKRRRHPKSMLYTILNPKSKQYPAVLFRYFISIVIIVDFIFFLLSTEPMFLQQPPPPPKDIVAAGASDSVIKKMLFLQQSPPRNTASAADDDETCYNYLELFNIITGISSSIFLLEYCGRIYTITESTKYGPPLGAIWSRLRYMTTPYMIIDLIATAPFFIELATGWDLPTLTFLRMFRLAKLLEASQGFAQAADAVFRVLYYNRQIMYLSIHVGFMMIITTSILLFYFRPPESHDESQEFQSILSTMYLACLMLTGQGGPDGDLPWYTKSVVLLTSAFSIGMFAIPVSMLTWGFEAEAERCAKRTRQLAKRKEAMNKAGGDSNSNFETFDYSTDEYSTDEEYQKIIAGEEEEEDGNEKDDPMLGLFRNLDSDDSGSLSLREFIDHMKSNNSGSGGGMANNIDGGMSARISVLEKKIDDIALKVDRLCDALAATKK